MRESESSGYGFEPELGARLRELRRRAGLSLIETAHLMGRGQRFYSHLSQLERGQVRHPSLSLVADYLRACRRSFADIVPLLDRYTNRPPVRETRARETALAGLGGDRSREAWRLNIYDLKTEVARKRAGQKPVRPEVRRQTLARQLRSAQEYRALQQAVEDEVNRLGVRPTFVVRNLALDYGRMVWKALEKGGEDTRRKAEPAERRFYHRDTETDMSKDSGQGTEGRGQKAKRGPGRPRKTREQRLAEADARMRDLAGKHLPARARRQLAGRVMRLYEELRG